MEISIMNRDEEYCRSSRPKPPKKVTFNCCDAMWNEVGWKNFCCMLITSCEIDKSRREVERLLSRLTVRKSLVSGECCILYSKISGVIYRLPSGYDSCQGEEFLLGLLRGCRENGMEMRTK